MSGNSHRNVWETYTKSRSVADTRDAFSQGISYGMYGTDGRLTQTTGFFETPGVG